MDGVAELLEAVDQAAFGRCAIVLVEVGGAEVDVWAIVLEQVPDDHQNGVTDSHSGLVPAAASDESAVLRRQVRVYTRSISVCERDRRTSSAHSGENASIT